MKSLDYSKKNVDNIIKYSNIVDHNFLTTHPSVIKKQKINIKNLHFLFIPVDKNIECLMCQRNVQLKIYSTQVMASTSNFKKRKNDSRIHFLNNLINKLENIDYDFYGFQNKEPLWGNDFYNALIGSKMGLNLSRGLPTKYYSSNRIASLMGNGLLTFVDRKTQLDDIFQKNEIIFYDNINDLSKKIKFYKKNDNLRKKIARNRKIKYFKLFNEIRIAKYITDISTGKNAKIF